MKKQELELKSDEELKGLYEETFSVSPGNRTRETQINELIAGSQDENSIESLQERLKAAEEENEALKVSSNTNSGHIVKDFDRIIQTEDQRIAIQKKQLNDKRRKQLESIDGGVIETMPASEDKKYEVIVGEEDRVHVRLLKRHYQAAINDFVHEMKVQKFWPRIYKNIEKHLIATHDTVEIVHIPKGVKVEKQSKKKKA